MDPFTRRPVGIGVHRGAVTGADLCRMFNAAIHGQGHTATSPVRVAIPCSRRIVGRLTYGFWRSTKSRPHRQSKRPSVAFDGGHDSVGAQLLGPEAA